jgi:hypothetical protein
MKNHAFKYAILPWEHDNASKGNLQIEGYTSKYVEGSIKARSSTSE